MSKKLAFSFLAVLSLFSFCSRDASELTKEDAILSESEVTALDDEPVEAKKFVEYACLTGNCAGTLCEPAKGTCSKAMPCTPLPGACVPPKPPTTPPTTPPAPKPELAASPDLVSNSRLKAQEIETLATEHATQMLKDGYIDQKGFETSKSLAKSILLKVRNK